MKKIILVVILVVALSFYFGFSTSAPPDEISGNIIDEKVSEEIELKIAVHLVLDPSGQHTTVRDSSNVEELFVRVNDVWNQAKIRFVIEEITIEEVPNLNSLPRFNDGKIHAFFAKDIGPNGIAFKPETILVADSTTVYDYRATSHEFGHILGLEHVSPQNRLMARGVNGFLLEEHEIEKVRETSKFFA